MARFRGQKGPSTQWEREVEAMNVKLPCGVCGNQVDVLGAEYHSRPIGSYMVLFFASHNMDDEAHFPIGCPGALQNIPPEKQTEILALVEIAR